MEKLDISKPIVPVPLTGISLDPRTRDPVVRVQIMGTIPFKVLMEKADTDSLKRIAEMAIDELNKRGNKW